MRRIILLAATAALAALMLTLNAAHAASPVYGSASASSSASATPIHMASATPSATASASASAPAAGQYSMPAGSTMLPGTGGPNLYYLAAGAFAIVLGVLLGFVVLRSSV